MSTEWCKLAEAEKDRQILLLHQIGFTWEKILENLGVTQDRIYRILKQNGGLERQLRSGQEDGEIIVFGRGGWANVEGVELENEEEM